MINPDHLRKLTNEAIANGKLRRKKELLEIEEKEARQRKLDEERANAILLQIPEKCEMEAKNERSHAIIMSLAYGTDYKFSPLPRVLGRGNDLKPEELLGAARIVWNKCIESKLKPSIEYWWSGDGMQSGHNILVKW